MKTISGLHLTRNTRAAFDAVMREPHTLTYWHQPECVMVSVITYEELLTARRELAVLREHDAWQARTAAEGVIQ